MWYFNLEIWFYFRCCKIFKK